MTNNNKGKLWKILASVFCVLSIIAVPVSFITMSELGDPDSLGLAGMLKYTWAMWLFIPIPAISFVLAIVTKKENRYCFLYIVIAIVCALLMGIFGAFRFMFNSYVSYDASIVIAVEEKTGLDFPDNIQVSNLYQDEYTETNIKITDPDEMRMFEQVIRENKLFITSNSEDYFALLPSDFEMLAYGGVFEYILFYNVTEQKYNAYSDDENCEYFFVLYNSYVPQIVIISSINSIN